MSETPGKRPYSNITPTKPEERIQRRKTHISPQISPEMADFSPEQPVNKIAAPWKTNRGRKISVDIHGEIQDKFADLSDRESILIRHIVDALETRMNDSFDYLHGELSDMVAKVRKAEEKASEIDIENAALKLQVDKCEKQIITLERNQVQAEIYSRRSNVQISGNGISRYRMGENEFRLRSWFMHVLHSLGCRHEVPIERIHWLGDSDNLIVRFRHFTDRQAFWRERFNSSRRFRAFVSEDFPPKVVEARKVLIPLCKEANLQNPNTEATVVADKLVIDRKSYSVHQLDALPKSLQSIRFGYKESDDAVVFFTKRSALSNHSMTPFHYDGKQFSSAEQCWMFLKAKCFNDTEIMKSVMDTHDPVKQKALGRSVKNLNMIHWKNQVPEVMYPVLLEKFKQNEGPRNILLNTGSRRLGEATTERYWGIGMKLSDPYVLNTSKWSNENIVGSMLERVRTELNRLGCY